MHLHDRAGTLASGSISAFQQVLITFNQWVCMATPVGSFCCVAITKDG